MYNDVGTNLLFGIIYILVFGGMFSFVALICQIPPIKRLVMKFIEED